MGGELEEISLYVKAGVGDRMGACPFCQRVYMVLLVKSRHNLLKFKVLHGNPAKPSAEFKALGLKHFPAILHKDEGFDAVDDIVSYLDEKFPGGNLEYSNPEADIATKDFFSKFCFYVKAVNQDVAKLVNSLQILDEYLEQTFAAGKVTENGDSPTKEKQYLCSDKLSHLDCEILPKLQHLRVAAKVLKEFDIPTEFKGLWRYLHTGYTDTVFTTTCPFDQEIILHWHDRPETPNLTSKVHAALSKEKGKYSFDIPVHASVIQVE